MLNKTKKTHFPLKGFSLIFITLKEINKVKSFRTKVKWVTIKKKYLTQRSNVVTCFCYIPTILINALLGTQQIKDMKIWQKVLAQQWNHSVNQSVQPPSCVWIFATVWIAAHQASLSITNSRSWPRLTSMESVMPSSHLILFCPLLLLPPIPPSIRVFSNESTLHMRWPKY